MLSSILLRQQTHTDLICTDYGIYGLGHSKDHDLKAKLVQNKNNLF